MEEKCFKSLLSFSRVSELYKVLWAGNSLHSGFKGLNLLFKAFLSKCVGGWKAKIIPAWVQLVLYFCRVVGYRVYGSGIDHISRTKTCDFLWSQVTVLTRKAVVLWLWSLMQIVLEVEGTPQKSCSCRTIWEVWYAVHASCTHEFHITGARFQVFSHWTAE